MVAQILTYPYLNRTLGSEIYGEIILQQIIVFHLQMIVFFGTDLSVVRLAAKYSTSYKKLKILVSKIILGRFYISLIISLSYVIYIYCSGLNDWFYFFVFSIFEAVITLRWFYHGIQQLNKFTLPFCLVRFLGVLLLFIFVNTQDDWYKVIIITVLSSLLSVIVSFYSYYVKYNLTYIKFRQIYIIFSDSFSLFATNIVSVIKDRSGGIFISYFMRTSSLVYYDFCMKIVGVISSITSSISASLYPMFSGNYNHSTFKRYNLLILLFSIIPFIITLLADKYVILLIDYIFSINIFDIKLLLPVFGFMIFVRSHGYFIGLCYLMALNYKKSYASSLIYSGMFYLFFMSGMIFLGYKNILTLAVGLSLSLLLEYFHRIYKFISTRKNANESHAE
ncbi:hypothetical protein ELY39_23125 [Escherichia coli]|nr:hypothetical protein ELY39_23125 [Escherichia coli]